MTNKWGEFFKDHGATKKLLRFGTDEPRCSDCGNDDSRALGTVHRSGTSVILCGTCRMLRRSFTPKSAARKAKRMKDAGYHKAACVICHDPVLQVLELDHVGNAANSAFEAPLCGTHHAIKSYMAERGTMANLRLRDPQRSALLLQAAFEMGFGAILGMWAVWDGANGETARSIFLGVGSVLLLAWAAWNIAADSYFEGVLGPGYDRAIPATVPR